VFTFVICLVVVGAALAITARIVMNGAPQPATHGASTDGAAPQRIIDGVEATPWWIRVRTVVVLTVLLTVIGACVALLVVLGGALVLTALKNAVQ
jgi:hypothetical protein